MRFCLLSRLYELGSDMLWRISIWISHRKVDDIVPLAAALHLDVVDLGEDILRKPLHPVKYYLVKHLLSYPRKLRNFTQKRFINLLSDLGQILSRSYRVQLERIFNVLHRIEIGYFNVFGVFWDVEHHIVHTLITLHDLDKMQV